MKLFRCINKGSGEYLTIGKIYEARIVEVDKYIEVKNDKGLHINFNIYKENPNFIDISEERNNKLNQIGI